MKLVQFIVLSVCMVLPEFIQAELFLVDQIDCVVCGPAYNKPITDTDITWKRTLDNQFIPLSKQIQNDIILQQISTEKMPMDPTATEKYVESLKKQLKINDAELEELFGQVGRTMAEGIEMLQSQYATEFFTHYKFKSQLVPTDDEILNYFNEYPDFVDGSYEIQIARVSYNSDERDEAKNKIEEFIKNPDLIDNDIIVWGKTLKISSDDLSADQKFIENMKQGEIQVQETEGTFELVKLLASEPTRIKALQERKNSIIDALNRKKLEQMLKNYNNSVKEFVDIIAFDKKVVQESEEES